MTGYCTASDVSSLNTARKMGVGVGAPTASDVQVYINMAAGEIDAILVNKGYQVPVNTASSPEAGTYLNAINATGAWMMWERAAPNSPNLDRASKAWDEAKAALVAARSVMDAPKDIQRAQPRGPGVTNPPRIAFGNEPFFRRDQRW